jgi:hypothetical protein
MTFAPQAHLAITDLCEFYADRFTLIRTIVLSPFIPGLNPMVKAKSCPATER